MCHKLSYVPTFLLVLGLCLPVATAAHIETIVLLHTNDLHAHLRSNDSGKGGLPYVAAYVKQVRQGRRDVLLLDGGDVLEKGDMLCWMTQGRVMYEAMNRIGYDAGVLGNHDFAYGPKSLKTNLQTAAFPIVCANSPMPNVPVQASTVLRVAGVRVGLIGLTVFSSKTFAENAAVLARETSQLENEVDLLIAICHLNSKTCLRLADAVPEIDVFVSGHSHEVLAKPLVAKKSGALIVQAGSLARYVGHWELTVDLDQKKVTGCHGKLVSLPHGSSACEQELVSWIKQQEELTCPESRRVVGKTDRVIRGEALAKLYAQSLLRATGADVALSHTSMLRGEIYPGPIDINDLFATYVPGKRREVVEVALTGKQLAQVIDRSAKSRGKLIVTAERNDWEPQGDQTYRVVLTLGNWTALRALPGLEFKNLKAKTLDVDLIDSLADGLNSL